MIKIEKVSIHGLEETIRGMRNPMNSWAKSDSGICKGGDDGIGCKNCANEVPCEEDIMWKRELIKNKLYSAALISLGALSIPIEYDATAFIFTLIMGLPLFFAKENWIM